MRVQDLLLAVPFLEGITEALAVIRRPLRAFKGIAKSAPERPEIKNISDLRFDELRALVYRLATMPTRHHSCPNRYWTRARDGVMLSLTMEEIRACIQFGAAHRVNFDTPPLQGNCPDTLVSQQIPLKTQHDYKTWYLARYRVNTDWRSLWVTFRQ
jgi:hypothetical protein